MVGWLAGWVVGWMDGWIELYALKVTFRNYKLKIQQLVVFSPFERRRKIVGNFVSNIIWICNVQIFMLSIYYYSKKEKRQKKKKRYLFMEIKQTTSLRTHSPYLRGSEQKRVLSMSAGLLPSLTVFSILSPGLQILHSLASDRIGLCFPTFSVFWCNASKLSFCESCPNAIPSDSIPDRNMI